MMKRKIDWLIIPRVTIAVILLQTVIRFKFPGHPDSVYIFTQMGMEPWGRYLTAVIELIASALLLTPNFCVYGALLSAGTMLGAIFGHFTKIGINPDIEGGVSLFITAVTIFILSCLIIYVKRRDLPFIDKFLNQKND